MIVILRRVMTIAALGAVSLGATAEAQRLVITPHVGYFLSTEDLFEAQVSGRVTYRLQPALWYGGSIEVGITPRIGLSLVGGHVATDLRRKSAIRDSLIPASLSHVAVQAVLRTADRSAKVSPYFNGGLGLMRRGGEAFRDEPSNSSLVAMLGAGVAVRMGAVATTVGLEVTDYSAAYAAAFDYNRKFLQRDLRFRVGIGWMPGGA